MARVPRLVTRGGRSHGRAEPCYCAEGRPGIGTRYYTICAATTPVATAQRGDPALTPVTIQYAPLLLAVAVATVVADASMCDLVVRLLVPLIPI